MHLQSTLEPVLIFRQTGCHLQGVHNKRTKILHDYF
jgi:hypothetical protein